MRSPLALLRLASIAGALACLTASGCNLYSNSDDDCSYGGGTYNGGAAPGAAVAGQRDPSSGQCVYYGGGGTCDDPCAPCPATGAADQAAMPSWGYCQSQCTGLDEQTCVGTSGCRAIYTDQCNGQPGCNSAPVYSECWLTDMTGPIEGGGCDGLDAYTCSQHDDCVAIHQQDCSGGTDPGGATPVACTVGGFLSCGAEPGDGGAGSCTGDVTCDVAPPVCPANATPGIADGCYTGYCIPLDSCQTHTPGQCYADVTCGDAAPLCPDGTTPGIADGCYTGYCIPLDKCEAAPACAGITVEATCVARQDCAPYYRGEGCSCDDTGCTCSDWVFDSCE